MNVLCGVGLLSTPYAAQQGGWLGIFILVSFGFVSFYTGMLLRSCLDSQPGLKTYPDIGHAAFGTLGRILISVRNLQCYHSLYYTSMTDMFLIILVIVPGYPVRGIICKSRVRCFCLQTDDSMFIIITECICTIMNQASCVEYIILESDSLSSLFPDSHICLYGGIQLDARQLFALLSVLVILPTVWLRDLSILSYISGEHRR